MILQYLGVAVLALVAVVLQSTLLNFMSEGMQVDFLFVIVVVIGLFKDPVNGSIMSAGVGYLGDVMSGDITGVFMTSRLGVFLMAQTLRGRLNPDTPASQFVIGLGLGVLDRVIVFILQQIFTEPPPLSGKEFLLMALGTLVNAALVPIFYFIFYWMPGFIEKPRGPRVVG